MKAVLFVGWGLVCLVLGIALLTCKVGTCEAASEFWGKWNCVYGAFCLAFYGPQVWTWIQQGSTNGE